MPKTNAIVNESLSVLEQAKESAKEILESEKPYLESIFDGKTLVEVESGIKNLNNYSEKCYIASALALYSIIYDQQLYTESWINLGRIYKTNKRKVRN